MPGQSRALTVHSLLAATLRTYSARALSGGSLGRRWGALWGAARHAPRSVNSGKQLRARAARDMQSTFCGAKDDVRPPRIVGGPGGPTECGPDTQLLFE